MSLRIVVTGEPEDRTTQGEADLELLFHHDAVGRPLTAEEVAAAQQLVDVVLRAGAEQAGGIVMLTQTANP